MDLVYLAEDQNATFDEDYHAPEDLARKKQLIRELFPSGPQSILDIGGGNGRFLDDILNTFTGARGAILDVSPHLLRLNASHPRKQLIEGSLDQAPLVLAGRQFQLITINWVLHHLIASSYGACRDNCLEALAICANHLTPDGVIIVAENMFQGFGGANIPSWVIYRITSVKNPWFVRKARRRFNTAGIGVCFRSDQSWRSLFGDAGLQVGGCFYGMDWPLHLKKRLMFAVLGIQRVRHGHFFLRQAGAAAASPSAPAIFDRAAAG